MPLANRTVRAALEEEAMYLQVRTEACPSEKLSKGTSRAGELPMSHLRRAATHLPYNGGLLEDPWAEQKDKRSLAGGVVGRFRVQLHVKLREYVRHLTSQISRSSEAMNGDRLLAYDAHAPPVG